MTEVPDEGEYFVRNGKVDSVAESDLIDSDSDHWAYTIWIPRGGDDDE
jgi:hypothetical protein